MRRWGFALILPLAAALAEARSPMEEARALVASYHENVARLDRARDLMEKRLKTDSAVDGMILLSRIYSAWGDVRARDDAEKLAAYDRGRQLGKRAVELAPKDPEAHFWYATNTRGWGAAKGVLGSLFLLPTLREEIDIMLELAPDHPGARGLAGNLELALPWGDLDKAEEHFRRGLKSDRHDTALRLDLARLLIRRGKHGEARKELRRVLGEKAPRHVADWTVKHTKRAKELLDSIKEKS